MKIPGQRKGSLFRSAGCRCSVRKARRRGTALSSNKALVKASVLLFRETGMWGASGDVYWNRGTTIKYIQSSKARQGPSLAKAKVFKFGTFTMDFNAFMGC